MTDKINNLPPSALQQQTPLRNKPAATGSSTTPNPAATAASGKDTVVLTNQAQRLAALERQVRDAGDVHNEKVEALRAEIDRGEYRIDAGKVADKLIAAEREKPTF